MTDRRRDEVVDAFLADLGAAQAPGDVAANVMRRVRDERPPRASRVPAWLAAAAALGTAVLVLVGLAVIAGGPEPSPSIVAPPPTPPAAETPSATPVPSTLVLPTPTPTILPAPPETLFSTHVEAVGTVRPGMDLTVADASGTVTGAESWPFPVPAVTPDGLPVLFEPGSDDHSVVVSWTGWGRDYRGRLEVEPDGRTMTLRLPAHPSQDLAGIGYAVQLRFSGPVDPATFSLRLTEDLVTVADISDPLALAFTDRRHGFTAWRAEPLDAVVLETTDGGASWRVEGLGAGWITALAVTGSGQAWAGVACLEGGLLGCSPGRYRFDADSRLWGRPTVPGRSRSRFLGSSAPGCSRPRRHRSGRRDIRLRILRSPTMAARPGA